MKTNFPPIFFTHLKKMYFSILYNFTNVLLFQQSIKNKLKYPLNKKILFSLISYWGLFVPNSL